MSENGPIRLSKAAKELNVGLTTVVDFLATKGIKIEGRPNTKIEAQAYQLLVEEYAPDRAKKQKSEALSQTKVVRETITLDSSSKDKERDSVEQDEILIKNVGGYEETAVEPSTEVTPVEPAVPAVQAPTESVEETRVEDKVSEKPKGVEIDTTDASNESADGKGPNILGKIDLSSIKSNRPKKKADEKKAEEKPAVPAPKAKEVEKQSKTPETLAKKEDSRPAKPEFVETKFEKLTGPKMVGKIELPKSSRPDKKSSDDSDSNKRKRKRITQVVPGKDNRSSDNRFQKGRKGPTKGTPKPELTEEQVQNQVRETLAALKNKGKSTRSKYRKERREAVSEKIQREIEQEQEDKKILKLTEFVTVSELATMMEISATEVISMCMTLGMMVSINQRLDQETLTILAEEFGFTVEFVGADIEESIQEEEDKEEDLIERPPIVTVMGHVDHGKTSLLDYIRRENVIAGEAGGITQHIGAYSVELEGGKIITFLDTPGHEAFTAMRARGAQVTDIAIIVIAADDAIMPQTVEAINHAQAAGVPMVFAFNKIDKDGANADKIREQLANMNILVEDWGGKFQSQEVSAKNGLNINELLEKVLLESELLELKANPERNARGTIIEASLDKGRGYTSTLLVQTGTMRVGDMILAGSNFGRVKAMFNERGAAIEEAGPSHPVSILGLNGAPSAGDTFLVLEDEREVKNLAF